MSPVLAGVWLCKQLSVSQHLLWSHRVESYQVYKLELGVLGEVTCDAVCQGDIIKVTDILYQIWGFQFE